jgi:hypothetical protein
MFLKPQGGRANRLLPFLLLIICSIPLFFMNVHEGHSWGGDDYAQYIKEAENISKGQPYYQSGYVFYDRNICYAPPQYPPGFPLLLAPVVKIWGLAIKPMCYLNTLMAVALMLVAFAYFRKQAGVLSSFCLTLIIGYSWYMVDVKQCVFSDLPCLLFTMLYLLYRHASAFKPWRLALLILFAAMAILVRTQSVLILAAEAAFIAIAQLKGLYKNRSIDKGALLPGAYIIAGTLAVNFIVTKFIFPAPSTASGFYAAYLSQVLDTGIVSIFRNNVNFLLQTISGFFFYETDNGFRTALVTIMQGAGLALSITGFTMAIRKRLWVDDIFFVLMVVLMLYYPIHDARYFLPVIVLIYGYCYTALRAILPAITKLPLRRVAIGLTALCLFTGGRYLKGTFNTPAGYVPAARDYQAFSYITQHVSDTDIIVFSRPRMLTLYTHKRSMVQAWLLPMDDNRKIFDSVKAKYMLTVKGLADDFYTRYFNEIKRPLDSVIIADGYTLYTIR